MTFLALMVLVISSMYANSSGNQCRIKGGSETPIENLPHQISIQYLEMHKCGGAIVTEKYVLTTAYCMPPKGTRPESITIRAGSSNRKRGGYLYQSSGWIGSPDYKSDILDSNVGFYKVKNKILFGPKVSPVQLISPGEPTTGGDMLTVAGWGSVLNYDGKKPDILYTLKLPILSQDFCRLAMEKSKFKITGNTFCAGGKVGTLLNTADFGNAAVNSYKKLVGVASWGRFSYPPSYPTVFTNITSPPIRRFIDSVLTGKLDTSQ